MAKKHMKRCVVITHYQKNENQNHNEVPSHAVRMAAIKVYKQ